MRLTRKKRWILGGLSFFVLLMLSLAVAAERFVEPALRRKINTLIVQGSDSLYNYKIDKLDVSLLGGHVEIVNLHIGVDSNRYRKLLAEKKLPSTTIQVNMPYGHLRGVGVLSLLLGRKVRIDELFTQDADIEVWRHGKDKMVAGPRVPLWKAIKPGIKEIVLKRLTLEGIRFAYRSESDSNSLQLKFDTCTVQLRDIRIDSIAAYDPERIGFCKSIKLHFYDLKYRSPDSAFKLKAKVIDYSSDEQLLTISEFKLQPTLKDKESFYESGGLQREMTVLEFARLDLQKFRLEEFMRNNAVIADSLIIDTPRIQIYTDKTLAPTLEGKMGQYPQQKLLHAATDIHIKGMAFRNTVLSYTERSEKSGREGTLNMDRLNIYISNVTNMPEIISVDSTCRVHALGSILGNSPIEANFNFFLNEPEGRFTADGKIGPVGAAKLNALSEPLGGIKLQSLELQQLQFSIGGNEYTAGGEVHMRYRNLVMILQKEDKETGLSTTQKFLTTLINKYTLLHDNPGPNGREAVARHVEQSRLMTQTFFGLVWNTIFSGMQTIMTNTADSSP